MGEPTDLRRQALDFVPIKPVWFQMLLVLAGGVRHGYAIRREVEERTDGAMRLWPTTLYGSLSKMEEAGLIEEVDDEPSGGDDDIDRVFYRLTALGRTVLLAETERLEELVRLSRARTAATGGA
jgi:DNA-binding PadR family transcriptional regulator